MKIKPYKKLSKTKSAKLNDALDKLNLEWYEQDKLIYARGNFQDLLALRDSMRPFQLDKILIRSDKREKDPTIFFASDIYDQYVAMKFNLNEEEKDILLNL